MCGIVGYVGHGDAMESEVFGSLRDSMRHRGPDDDGLWRSSDNRAIFGHRRLAIIDPSPTGSQPMVLAEDGIAITFNGEIYNHEEVRSKLKSRGVSFRGRSDTEVLLLAYREWGEGCLDLIRGMFAFGIYHGRDGTLFLARDRAGEKPLYWTRLQNGVLFASELKAFTGLTSFQARLSPQGLAFYLAYGYVPGEFCILDEVWKIPPGHCASWSIDRREMETRRYWNVPLPDKVPDRKESNLGEELEDLLGRAVREQLEADVPVAVLLSGGVDSSLVTAVAARSSAEPVRTYSVSIRGFPQFDESKYAQGIASYFGTQHTELTVDPSSVEVIEALSRQYDEPIYDSSMIPTFLLARAVSRECKAVLGGDGADELFGGYRTYQGLIFQEKLRRRMPEFLRAVIATGAERLLPIGADRRNGLIGLRGGTADGLAQAGTLFDERDRVMLCPWLLGKDVSISPREWRRGLVELERGLPGAAMAADFRTYLAEDILVKVDRASMLCSLEVRAPFLDRRIVEFAFRRVPNALRANSDGRKLLLREVAARVLPVGFDVKRKQGFSIPLWAWLTSDFLHQWQEEYGKEIKALFCPRMISRIIKRRNEGCYHRMFALIMLTKWMRHYRVHA